MPFYRLKFYANCTHLIEAVIETTDDVKKRIGMSLNGMCCPSWNKCFICAVGGLWLKSVDELADGNCEINKHIADIFFEKAITTDDLHTLELKALADGFKKIRKSVLPQRLAAREVYGIVGPKEEIKNIRILKHLIEFIDVKFMTISDDSINIANGITVYRKTEDAMKNIKPDTIKICKMGTAEVIGCTTIKEYSQFLKTMCKSQFMREYWRWIIEYIIETPEELETCFDVMYGDWDTAEFKEQIIIGYIINEILNK